MLYLVDNYDSFTYNLYQLIGELSSDPIRVVKNDQLTASELAAQHPDRIVLSPGPGKPNQSGSMMTILDHFIGQVPILGVCLGHQGIGEAFGAKIVHAPHLMHGRADLIWQTQPSRLLRGCPPKFMAARYHSLVIDPQTIPSQLKVIAKAADGTIQAVEDDSQRVYGVQFHPESIMTDPKSGQQIIKNFLAISN